MGAPYRAARYAVNIAASGGTANQVPPAKCTAYDSEADDQRRPGRRERANSRRVEKNTILNF